MACLHMIHHMGREFLLFIQYNFTKYCCSTLKNKNYDYQQLKQFFCKTVLFLLEGIAQCRRFCGDLRKRRVTQRVVGACVVSITVAIPLGLNKCKNQKYVREHS